MNLLIERIWELLVNEKQTKILKAGEEYISTWVSDHLPFIFYSIKNHIHNRIKYDAICNPFKTIEIRPSKIEFILGRTEDMSWGIKKPEDAGLGKIKGGNWDIQYRSNIKNSYIIRSLHKKFKKDLQWEKTEYYEHRFNYYNNMDISEQKGYDDLHSYMSHICEKNDKLYQNIKNKGYKKTYNGPRIFPRGIQRSQQRLEVLVNIDRDGNIGFLEGNHRFGIAKALDIKIPVQVAYRHKQWQKTRDNIYNNGFSQEHEELRGHPDLQGIHDE